jgi:hypothetical protein
VSVPFPAGLLGQGQGLVVSDGRQELAASLRVLTWHPARGPRPRTVRRGLVSFPYEFADQSDVSFSLHPVPAPPGGGRAFPAEVAVNGETVTVRYGKALSFQARLLAPPRTARDTPRIETVESNAAFRWQRIHLADPGWPRIIEVRTDARGGVLLQAHLQRNVPGDGYAPDFGWEIQTRTPSASLQENGQQRPVRQELLAHRFAEPGNAELLLDEERYRIFCPCAAAKGKGRLEVQRREDGVLACRYLRSTVGEKVPMQQAAWRRAEVWIGPAALAPPTASLESPHAAAFDGRLWDELYQVGQPPDLKGQPDLAALLRYHHDGVIRSMALGDDWGNVTAFADEERAGAAHGMNRLNHCLPICEEAWRSGNRRLRDVAVLWCSNFHDLSIWWGPGSTGGTRYNNVRAQGRTPLDDNRTFMWRSNDAVHFCTKGFSAFFLAYEETGDPRMHEALEAQVRYAARHVHADRGEARNIGDVDDFVRLYRWTQEAKYLDEALRLFRELRTKLSPGGLFSQSGQPIVADPPFINDDETGTRHPFAKPYIIGYALAGLPRLARHAGDEAKLRDVIRAVADFLAESQDPLGGWRYPHPRSSTLLLSMATEHAWQIAEADRFLGTSPEHLDAVERVLRQRILGWKKTGRILSVLTGWEFAAGKARLPRDLGKLYARPADRDARRDYAEGELSWGSSPPEGLVYFPDILAFYLQHRRADRLLAPLREDEPLGKVLARVKGDRK